MKKVIILAIVLIYIASIFIVNFFGLEIAVFDGTVYVEEIRVDSVTMYDLSGGDRDVVIYEEDAEVLTLPDSEGVMRKYSLYRFPFTEAPDGVTYTEDNIAENPNQVLIELQVLPYDADHKGVSFVVDEKDVRDGKAVFLEDRRTVVFLKPDVVIGLTLKAVDGSNVQTERFYLEASPSR